MNELLLERERRGLRFALYFSLAMMLPFVGLSVVSAQSVFEVAIEIGFIAVSSVITVVNLVLTSRGRAVRSSGWILVVLYVLINAALPWIWYNSVGGAAALAHTYLLKTNIAPYTLLFLILVCLPGKPLYPAVFTVGSTLSYAVMIAAATNDPRSQFTELFVESYLGPSASISQTYTTVVVNVVCGGILTFFLHRFRTTVIDASKAEHSTAQLGRYFSPGLVPIIAQSDTAFLKPGGKLQEVTVLFSDIRGFTTLAEGLEPRRVVELLSLYQEQMVAAIFEHGGTLDKFIGDGIMATFGTPIPADDDALRAVRAARAMTDRLVGLNRQLVERGFPELRHGIGVHCGQVIAGNVGTAARLEYTVIGDVVNTAARLETLCKQTGDGVLVSKSVADRVGSAADFGFEPRGTLELKGKMTALEVLAVADRA